MEQDIIVVGGGPAGLTAALYARRAGYTVTVVEGGVPGGQATTTPHVENWPGTLSIPGSDLAMGLYQQAESLGAKFHFAAVTGLEAAGEEKRVRLSDGSALTAPAVILAGGVKRRKLNVPGEERYGGRGVSYCGTCDGSFFKGKDVAVVGGGNTAVEDAVYLAGLCPTVYLIHRRDALRAEKYMADRLQSKPNIQCLFSHQVREVVGDGQKVTALDVEGPSGRRSLSVSALFVAVGLIPDNSPFAPLAALDEAGYLIAGEDCKTNIPGVFAAGDCRTKELRQLVTAAADGAMAAHQAGKYLQER